MSQLAELGQVRRVVAGPSGDSQRGGGAGRHRQRDAPERYRDFANISENIKGVAMATAGTSSAASEVQSASSEPSRLAEELRALVSRFNCV